VQDQGYLIHLYRYIELNPVRAEMVKDPADYSWSSYQCNGLGTNTVGQLALNAKNINITAGTNTDKESTESRSEGASASYGSSGGYSGSVNGSKSNSSIR
jgi:hypothetical protein